MSELNELGLSAGIVAAARAAGYAAATPLQVAAIPVLRRGGNAVLHASAGSGVTAAVGMPLLDRLAEAANPGSVRALVLTPTAERAEEVAAGLAVLAVATGVAVRSVGAGWRTAGADVLVATPTQALGLVQDSTLKLEAVQTLAIIDAAEQFVLGLGEKLEMLIPLVPRDAQRIVTSGELTDPVEKLIEAHARRALTIPARPADPHGTHEREPMGQIGYVVVQEEDKLEMVARLLESVDEHALTYARTAERAAHIRAELERRGIITTSATVRVVAFGHVPDSDVVRVISYDVPFSAGELRTHHQQGGTVLVTPHELKHLQRIAGELPFTLKHRRARDIERDTLDAFRASIRTAFETEDLSAMMLILEPLLEERSADEVAAALCALLRRRSPVAAPTAETGASAAAAARSSSGATFTRLFVSIGTRDNVRPGDLVGAITGEAGIKGDQVGRVDIRDTFSVVEVAAAAADKVIRALNGTTMRGRSLRVDYDRKSGASNEERRGAPGAARGAMGDRAPRDRPPRDGAPRDRPPRDGPARDRPPRDGPPRRPRER